MDNLRKISFIILVVSFFGCTQKNMDTEEETIHVKTIDTIIYGPISQIKNTVEINLYAYQTIDSLHSRITDITCNNSYASISYKSGNDFKQVVLVNSCPSEIGCHFYRNMIRFYNDSILRYSESSLPIDSFSSLLKKHLNNHGQNSDYADAPRMLLIDLTFDSLSPNILIERIDFITKSYKKIKDTTDIKIRLSQYKESSLIQLDSLTKDTTYSTH